MTDPRPVDMLLRGYGVDDVRVKTGLSYGEIVRIVWQSSHRDALRPHHKIALSRAINANRRGAA